MTTLARQCRHSQGVAKSSCNVNGENASQKIRSNCHFWNLLEMTIFLMRKWSHEWRWTRFSRDVDLFFPCHQYGPVNRRPLICLWAMGIHMRQHSQIPLHNRGAAHSWTIYQDDVAESVDRRFVQGSSTTRYIWRAISSYFQCLNVVTEILWPAVVEPRHPLSKQLMQRLPLRVSTGQSESGRSCLSPIIWPCSYWPYLAKLL